MQQTGQTVSKVDKCTVRFDGFHGSFSNQSDLNVGNFCLAFFICFFTQDFSCGKYETFFFCVSIDDTDFQFFAEPVVQFIFFYIVQGKFGCRDETADAVQICNCTGFYNAADFNGQVGAFFHIFFEFVPCKNIICFFGGEQNVSFSVISADHSCGDFITCMYVLFQIKIRITCEILQADDTVGVIFQIQCDLRFGNADYRSGEDITFMDLFERCFQFFGIVSHRFCRFFQCF